MSKHTSAPNEAQGIPTPCTLASSAKVVKFGAMLNDHALTPMGAAVEQLSNIAELARIIRETACHGLDEPNTQAHMLKRIGKLAKIAEYQASDFCDYLGVEHEQTRDECVPAILAALEGKK